MPTGSAAAGHERRLDWDRPAATERIDERLVPLPSAGHHQRSRERFLELPRLRPLPVAPLMQARAGCLEADRDSCAEDRNINRERFRILAHTAALARQNIDDGPLDDRL